MINDRIGKPLQIAVKQLNKLTETRCFAFGDSGQFIGIDEDYNLCKEIYVIADKIIKIDERMFNSKYVFEKILDDMKTLSYKAPVIVIEDARLVGFQVHLKYGIGDRFQC